MWTAGRPSRVMKTVWGDHQCKATAATCVLAGHTWRRCTMVSRSKQKHAAHMEIVVLATMACSRLVTSRCNWSFLSLGHQDCNSHMINFATSVARALRDPSLSSPKVRPLGLMGRLIVAGKVLARRSATCFVVMSVSALATRCGGKLSDHVHTTYPCPIC
jgi:hypothetical protein